MSDVLLLILMSTNEPCSVSRLSVLIDSLNRKQRPGEVSSIRNLFGQCHVLLLICWSWNQGWFWDRSLMKVEEIIA